MDVISNRNGETVLFAAPDWTPHVLHSSIGEVYASVGFETERGLAFIGARYSPGLIFELLPPGEPLRQPWEFRVIDDSGRGGVDGVHGMAVADVDGDGRSDLIANSAHPAGRFPNSLAWFTVAAGSGEWERNILPIGTRPG